ncbi:bifunctional diguanylate cyclase/phosphodiesterase [Pseudokineococcus marinus]|uniref:Bifunctional diguanylate cyclase/phosphodiesterase n=1 Tax=Pseudokineococcus marinus TaxID=351215 RepID=A0A849BVM1_9ACTN|nr:bifunctional diguanylate cyclase/phosphodiesterase [Pseudokineococcus marinus]NNH23546.1 bifunctional diguanylate cyclase/phosphodiesterase [Pseudokineococcus marinus]
MLGVAARAAHLVRDLSQLAVRRQEALTDDLTGAGNRRGLAHRLGASDAWRGRALLLLDLDRFKEVNDLHGHATGDLLLQEVAVRLHGVLPADAYLARPGGDEFAVVLGPRSAGTAPAVAAAVGRALERPVLLADRRLVVGGSVGLACADGGSDLTGEELLRRADVAMYTAKAAGGGVSRYDRELDRAAQDAALLLEELRTLLGAGGGGRRAGDGDAGVGRLVVHHQVQLDAAGRVVGTEALVRWSHPRRGLVPPDAFLPLAERHGLMSAVTRHVLRRALEEAAVWRREGRALRTSVNLSTSCLSDPSLPGAVAELLASTGTPPSALVLEVPETTLMADPDAAVAAARRLVALGAGVSIDDYGTGYSSLAYLQDLPVTELKLDRVFAARVADERTSAIVAGTVELAHRLGVRVVAEGVEDEDVLARLLALGCDETQGYLHGRPAPADEVLVRPPGLVPEVAPAAPVAGPRTPGDGRDRAAPSGVPSRRHP